MNKKVVGLFAVFLVAVFAMGAVSAADLSSHDFDGYFTMNVPNDVSFQMQDDSINENGLEAIFVSYLSEDLVVSYMDSFMFSGESSYYLYQGTFQSINPDLTQCWESQEDNLRILEPTTNDDVHFALVGTNSGNKTVMLVGDDVGLLKEMGHSIKFNE